MKRRISLKLIGVMGALLAVLLLPFMSLRAVAGVTGSMSNTNIGLTAASGDWTVSNDTVSCSFTGATSAELTITNGYNTVAVLSFKVAGEIQAGGGYATTTVTVNSSQLASVKGGLFSKSEKKQYSGDYTGDQAITLAAGATVSIKLQSTNKNGNASATITNLTLVQKAEVSVTFAPRNDNLSYTVSYYASTTATEMTTNTVSTAAVSVQGDKSRGFTVTASGYAFLGANYTYSSDSAEAGYLYAVAGAVAPETGYRLTPDFIEVPSGGIAPFSVNGSLYWTWETAVNATGGQGTVILNASTYTLPTTYAENGLTKAGLYITGRDHALIYTIPSGVNFLVPCTSTDTGVFGEMPSGAYASTATPSTFRTLTVPAGAKIVCDGTINVNGHRREDGQGANGPGAPRGAHGKLILAGSGTQLEVNGVLTCYGFVTGSGTVEVTSTGTTYEFMQMYDWPGGTNLVGEWTSFGNGGWKGAATNKTLFFASKYYVQNIESPLKVSHGGTMKMETVLTAANTTVVSSSELIGDTGLFQLGEGTHIIRTYDAATDRVTYRSGGKGTISIGSITVTANTSFGSVTLNSASYTLPLNNALTVHIGDGVTANISNRFALVPGSELIVDDGGTLNLTSHLYIIGKDDWTTAMSFSAQMAPLYTAGRGTTVKMEVDSSGRLVVNGVLNVSGGVYTTGAIDSSTDKVICGTGKIVHTGSLTDGELQGGYSATLHDFSVSAAYILHPGDTALKNIQNYTYYGLGTAWYTHRVDYYEGSTTGTAVLIPSLTTYSVGGFPEGANAVEYEHDEKLFTGLATHADTWNDFADKYEYNDEAQKDQFVQAYYRVCNAKLLVYDKPGGEADKLTLEYRLNDYIWLNASGYLDFDSATFDKSKLTVSGDCELLVVGNVVYIVRRVVAKELPETMTITLAYDGIPSAPFTVDFGAYKTLLEGKETTSVATKTLLTAMMTYGKAAANHFSSGSYDISVELNMDQSQDVTSGWTAGATSGTPSVSTKSAKIYFDEALRMSVYFAPSGIDMSQVKQVGLLVGTASGTLEGSTAPATYVIYNILEDVEINPGGIGNYPTGNTGLAATILDYTELPTLDEKGRWEVCFDLSAGAYLKSFELRPYVLLADGSYIYGEQVHYSLAAYISRMYEKSSDLKFKNLLAATWEYAVAADEAF